MRGSAMLVGMLLGGVAAMPAAAQYDAKSGIPMTSAMTTQCSLGNPTLSKGSTPTSIPGVTIVTAQQAKCLIDRFSQQVLVVAAMPDQEQLPDAHPVPILASSTDNADFQAGMAKDFTPLTGGNLQRPVLIYCHHASCQYSANGAEHLARAGYKTIFWLRDGTQGWRQAGYAFSAKPRLAPGASLSVTRFNEGRKYTFGCFGESKHDACQMMVGNFYESYTAPDAKPTDKPFILDQLLNAVAVYGDNLRTGGKEKNQTKDLKKSISVLEEGMKLMRASYAGGAHPEVIRGNLKLQQNMALAYFAADRPADAAAAIRDARAAADAAYAGLEAVRKSKDKLSEAQSNLIGAEKLEREIGDYANGRAQELYKAGNKAEAAKYLAVALPAYTRNAQWIGRVDKEGVAGFAEQDGVVRLAELKVKEGDLKLAAGDKPGANTSYHAARVTSCPQLTDATVAAIKSRSGISDVRQFSLARACQRGELGEMKANGEYDRMVGKMSDDMMRREYQKLGLDWDKLKNKK